MDLFGPFHYGPYGTNEGDIWSGEHSDVGKRIKEEHGGVMIHEMMRKDGKLQEGIYWVEESNPDMEMQDLIKRAREGLKKWIAAQGKLN
jgi:hypothetical protein